MRTLAGFGLAALLLVGPTGLLLGADRGSDAGRYPEQKVQKSFPAQGIREVKATLKVGSIRVFSDSPDSVQVTAVRSVKGEPSAETRRWLEQSRVEISRQGDAVLIKDIVPERQGRSRSGESLPRLNVEVHMPADLALQSSTGVGDTEVEGRVRALSLESGVGNVRLKSLRCSGDQVNVKTGVGDVVVALQSLPMRLVKIEVGVGKATISLPSDARARVRTTTGVGKVASAFGTARARRGGMNLGGTVAGDLNGGGIPLEVNVGVGDAHLVRED